MLQCEATQDALSVLHGPYRLTITEQVTAPLLELTRRRSKGRPAVRFMGRLEDARTVYEYGVLWDMARSLFGTVKRPYTPEHSAGTLAAIIHAHYGGCNEQCVAHCYGVKGRTA